MSRKLLTFVIISMIILPSCSTKSEIQITSSIDGNSQNPYPDTESKDTTPEAYPAPIEYLSIDSYPPPEEIPSDIFPFKFDKPVLEGDTKISGTGPAGVPIEVVNVTLMRLVLAQGTIENDNTFSFDLNEPLEKGHRIGIALAELAGTEWTKSQFANSFYNGSQALNVPTVGFFYDTALVK